MNRTYGWMSGWMSGQRSGLMGGGVWLWTLAGIVLLALFAVIIIWTNDQ